MKTRLILDGDRSGFLNMGIDEALFTLSKEPILRIYFWNPPCVTIGYFQSLEEELDMGKCKELGIDYTRRITGGGAVFHENEITYSFICRISERKEFSSIEKSYELICGGIVEALKAIGLDAMHVPINDVLANGKKISGSAQTRRNGKLLQHGTLILKLDAEKMFSILKVPEEKLKDKMIRNAKERVGEAAITREKAQEILVEGFGKALGLDYVESKASGEEMELARKLEKKFKSREWIFRR